jgi:hypothetical protein
MTRTVFLLAALLAASPAAAYYWRYNPYGFDNRYRGLHRAMLALAAGSMFTQILRAAAL